MLPWQQTEIYIYGGNDTRIRIEPFGTRLSVRYALQTKRFVGLILLHLENKSLKCVKYNILSATALNNTAQTT